MQANDAKDRAAPWQMRRSWFIRGSVFATITIALTLGLTANRISR